MPATFVKRPREEMERIAHEQYLARYPRGRPEPAKIANVNPLLGRDRAREFEYRGRRYVVPPIDYREGAALQLFIQTEMQPWTDKAPTWETMDEYEAVCAASAEMVWRLCRPAGWRRFLKRWMHNPFMRAGDNELSDIIGFFWQCRTKSSVRLLGLTTGARA